MSYRVIHRDSPRFEAALAVARCLTSRPATYWTKALANPRISALEIDPALGVSVAYAGHYSPVWRWMLEDPEELPDGYESLYLHEQLEVQGRLAWERLTCSGPLSPEWAAARQFAAACPCRGVPAACPRCGGCGWIRREAAPNVTVAVIFALYPQQIETCEALVREGFRRRYPDLRVAWGRVGDAVASGRSYLRAHAPRRAPRMPVSLPPGWVRPPADDYADEPRWYRELREQGARLEAVCRRTHTAILVLGRRVTNFVRSPNVSDDLP